MAFAFAFALMVTSPQPSKSVSRVVYGVLHDARVILRWKDP